MVLKFTHTHTHDKTHYFIIDVSVDHTLTQQNTHGLMIDVSVTGGSRGWTANGVVVPGEVDILLIYAPIFLKQPSKGRMPCYNAQ